MLHPKGSKTDEQIKEVKGRGISAFSSHFNNQTKYFPLLTRLIAAQPASSWILATHGPW